MEREKVRCNVCKGTGIVTYSGDLDMPGFNLYIHGYVSRQTHGKCWKCKGDGEIDWIEEFFEDD